MVVRILILNMLFVAIFTACSNGILQSTSFEGFSQAYSFNGTSSNTVITGLSQTLPTSFTIEFYFKTNASGLFQYFVDYAGSLSKIYMNATNNIVFMFTNGSCAVSGSITSPLTYNDGSVHHVAGVINGSNAYLYIDGSMVISTGGVTGVNCPVTAMYIGSSQSSTNWLNGVMDEVRVSNSARYFANFTRPTSTFNSDASTMTLLHLDFNTGSDYIFSGGAYTKNNITIINSPVN